VSAKTEPPTGTRVLVVDDDLHTRDLLRELCESQGHEVAVANDGPGALQQVEAFKPDLVLLDVMLPGLDGFAVLARLRQTAATAQLAVIILTAATDLEGKIRGIELGADDYVTKPFRLFELTSRLKAVLTVRQVKERLHAAESELQGLRSAAPGEPAGYPQLRAGLSYELARSKRYGRPMAVLLLSIDNFDALRGELGRADFDRFTAGLGAALNRGLRETDRLFRIDLDEFMAVLPETDAKGAEAARTRLLASLTEQPHRLELTAGIGMAVDPAHSSPEELMRAAQRDLEGRQRR
jgi:diguanylate cyclase (GGDEF)-like protein